MMTKKCILLSRIIMPFLIVILSNPGLLRRSSGYEG